MALATIVIPTYKRPDRIERAVKSALNQSCEVEVIVVDDNGKNTNEARETYNALKEYIDSGKIKYLQNEVNSGGSFTRNQGLNIATSKYITFLDDDDEIDKYKIEKQVNKLESLDDSYSSVYTAYHKVLENGKIYKSNEVVEGNVYKYVLARSIYNGSGSNLLVKTSIAKEIGGYDIRFKRNQDLEFMARMLKNYKLAYLDEDLFTIHYEIREVKRSYDFWIKVDEFYLNSFKEEIAKLEKKDQKYVYDVIALERYRKSIPHNIVDGLKNIVNNRVSFIRFINYNLYVLNRIIKKESYGFKG